MREGTLLSEVFESYVTRCWFVPVWVHFESARARKAELAFPALLEETQP